MIMRVPPFHHEKAVAKYVEQTLREIADEDERIFYTEMMPQLPPNIRIKPPSPEQHAVFDAERGDLKALAELITSGAPLAAPTRVLLSEFLTRKRSLKTGKIGGGQEKTEEELRSLNPAHDAVDEFHAIYAILKTAYSDTIKLTAIRIRAEELAAERNGARLKVLQNRLRAGKKKK
jgi:hypothetical protein